MMAEQDYYELLGVTRGADLHIPKSTKKTKADDGAGPTAGA